MRNMSTAIGVAILVAWTAAVRSQPLSGEAKALYEKREQYKRTVREPLRRKVEERRQALTQEADLKDLHFLIAKAQKAYDAVMANDAEILAARQAEKAAEKAMQETIEAQLAGNAKIQTVESEIKAARQAEKQCDAEEDRLQKELETIREEVRKAPEIQEARQAYESAQRTYYEMPYKHPTFVAARQAVKDAEKALQERIKDLPETKALEQAKKAYNDLRYNSQEIKDARQAREEARQAYEEILGQAVRASEKGAAVYQRLEAVRQKEVEAEAMQEGLNDDLRDLRRSVGESDPAIIEARKAYSQAHAKYGEVSARRSAAERKALEGARGDLAVRIQKKMKLDPVMLDLLDRLRKAEKYCDELQAKYRKARERSARQRQ